MASGAGRYGACSSATLPDQPVLVALLSAPS